jgi:hypothetical protein
MPWLLLTYLGGIALKTTIYAKTVAGNQHRSPAKNTSHPVRPTEAGAANARKKPSMTQGIRCHQIGIIGAPQYGQFSSGGRVLMPAPRSIEQLGQPDQGIFRLSSGEKCGVMILAGSAEIVIFS